MKHSKSFGLIILIAFSLSFNAFSQTVNEVSIGTVANGELAINNTHFLNKYFNASLENDGLLGDFKLNYSPSKLASF